MRSTPAIVTGVEHPFEFRVRFHAPVRRVRTVSLEEASTPKRPEVVEPKPQPQPQPKPALPPPPPANVSPPAAPPLPPPTDFWPPDLEQELNADRERIESVLSEVQTSIANLREEHESRLQELRRLAIELAMTAAARILHERIASGDFPIDAKVRDMIAQLGEDVPVVVRLNPLDLELLKSRLNRAGDESLVDGPDAPRFVPDSTLNRGECQVEGRESMLMSDVSRELQDIREDLLRSLDNARP